MSVSLDRFGYLLLLKQEIELRQQKNPRYSLRAFSKQVGLSSGYLSQILSRKKKLSLTEAQNLALAIGWSESKRTLFELLVQYCWASSPEVARKLCADITRLEQEKGPDFFQISSKETPKISEWYHMAIAELTTLPGFQSDVRWIASRLGITLTQAKAATRALIEVGLLEEYEGRLRKKHAYYGIGKTWTPAQKRARDRLFRQNLEVAASRLRNPPEERNFSRSVLAVSRKKIPEARQLIREFHARFQQLMESDDHDSVYALTVQFFRYDRD